MSNIPASKKFIQTEATQFRNAVSESLMQIIGGSINYALDKVDQKMSTSDLVRLKLTGTVSASGTMGSTTVAMYACPAGTYALVQVQVFAGGPGAYGSSILINGTVSASGDNVPFRPTVFLMPGDVLAVSSGVLLNWSVTGIEFKSVTGL